MQPPELAADAMSTWDFLNTFRKQVPAHTTPRPSLPTFPAPRSPPADAAPRPPPSHLSQMSLQALSLDAFVDLLNYTGRASPALAEIYIGPLKVR